MEVWTGRGLLTYYLLFMISLADRVVEILGVTTRPDEGWTLQVGRNLIDCKTGPLRDKRYLIIDRNSKYAAQFCRLLRDAGTQVIRYRQRRVPSDSSLGIRHSARATARRRRRLGPRAPARAVVRRVGWLRRKDLGQGLAAFFFARQGAFDAARVHPYPEVLREQRSQRRGS